MKRSDFFPISIKFVSHLMASTNKKCSQHCESEKKFPFRYLQIRSISFLGGFWQVNIHAQLMWELGMYSLSGALTPQVSHKPDWSTCAGTFLLPSFSPGHRIPQEGGHRAHLLSGQVQLHCWCGKHLNLGQIWGFLPLHQGGVRIRHPHEQWTPTASLTLCPSAEQLSPTGEKNWVPLPCAHPRCFILCLHTSPRSTPRSWQHFYFSSSCSS